MASAKRKAPEEYTGHDSRTSATGQKCTPSAARTTLEATPPTSRAGARFPVEAGQRLRVRAARPLDGHTGIDVGDPLGIGRRELCVHEVKCPPVRHRHLLKARDRRSDEEDVRTGPCPDVDGHQGVRAVLGVVRRRVVADSGHAAGLGVPAELEHDGVDVQRRAHGPHQGKPVADRRPPVRGVVRRVRRVRRGQEPPEIGLRLLRERVPEERDPGRVELRDRGGRGGRRRPRGGGSRLGGTRCRQGRSDHDAGRPGQPEARPGMTHGAVDRWRAARR